jgi:hypothetical protein
MNRSRPSRYQFWSGTLISLKSVWFADQPRKQPIGQSNNQLRKQLGSRFMTEANLRLFLEMLAIGAGGGHTVGYDDVGPLTSIAPGATHFWEFWFGDGVDVGVALVTPNLLLSQINAELVTFEPGVLEAASGGEGGPSRATPFA